MARSCARIVLALIVSQAPAPPLLPGRATVSPALAASWVVTKPSDTDDGACDLDCSLREAIAAASSGDLVSFDNAVRGTIALPLGQLVLDKQVTLAGPGSEELTLSGGYQHRILRVTATGDLTASGLTFAHGQGEYYAPLGDLAAGAVLANGAVAFEDCVFTDNHSDGTTGTVNNDAAVLYSNAVDRPISFTRCLFDHNTAAAGACLDVDAGVLTIRDSVFHHNRSSLGVTSGVISNSQSPALIEGSTFYDNESLSGGVVWVSNLGGTTIRNSTLTGNVASLYGGAIFVAGTLQLSGVTLSGNSAATGANLFAASGSTVTTTHAIFDGPDGNCAGSGTIVSQGYNADSGASCLLSGDGDLNGALLDLLPLHDNGGPTPTMALTTCSAALDAGSDTGCDPVDQRGVGRPQGSRCDIGAYELSQTPSFLVGFCRDARTLGWTPASGAVGYDLARGRISVAGGAFDGDFSSFLSPEAEAACAPSCSIGGTTYDTSCLPSMTAGTLEMWLVRARGTGEETWDGGGVQAVTRDDTLSEPNPHGVPVESVCP